MIQLPYIQAFTFVSEEPGSLTGAKSFIHVQCEHFGCLRSPKWLWSLCGGKQMQPACLTLYAAAFLKIMGCKQPIFTCLLSISGAIQGIIPPIHCFLLKYSHICCAVRSYLQFTRLVHLSWTASQASEISTSKLFNSLYCSLLSHIKKDMTK